MSHPAYVEGLVNTYLDDLCDGRSVVIQLQFLQGGASRVCSKLHEASWCSSHQAFPQSILLEFKSCNYTVVLTWLQLWRILIDLGLSQSLIYSPEFNLPIRVEWVMENVDDLKVVFHDGIDHAQEELWLIWVWVSQMSQDIFLFAALIFVSDGNWQSVLCSCFLGIACMPDIVHVRTCTKFEGVNMGLFAVLSCLYSLWLVWRYVPGLFLC